MAAASAGPADQVWRCGGITSRGADWGAVVRVWMRARDASASRFVCVWLGCMYKHWGNGGYMWLGGRQGVRGRSPRCWCQSAILLAARLQLACDCIVTGGRGLKIDAQSSKREGERESRRKRAKAPPAC